MARIQLNGIPGRNAHTTFDTNKAQSVNKHINRLTHWRDARINAKLDVGDLSNAIALATEHLHCLGYTRNAPDMTLNYPSVSVGWLEQIQQALMTVEPSKSINVALFNIAKCIDEAKRVNEYARRPKVFVVESEPAPSKSRFAMTNEDLNRMLDKQYDVIRDDDETPF